MTFFGDANGDSGAIDGLRAARRRSGLSQATIAAHIGTTQSAVARMETAGTDPRLSTVERYVRALGARLVIEFQTPTLVATATDITTALAAGTPEDALRVAIQFVDDFERLDTRERPMAIRDEPGSTGRETWDALLAGLAEHCALHHGLRVPGWACAPARFLSRFWFVIEDILGRPAKGLAAIAFASAPPSFANRGVFLDPSALISI